MIPIVKYLCTRLIHLEEENETKIGYRREKIEFDSPFGRAGFAKMIDPSESQKKRSCKKRWKSAFDSLFRWYPLNRVRRDDPAAWNTTEDLAEKVKTKRSTHCFVAIHRTEYAQTTYRSERRQQWLRRDEKKTFVSLFRRYSPRQSIGLKERNADQEGKGRENSTHYFIALNFKSSPPHVNDGQVNKRTNSTCLTKKLRDRKRFPPKQTNPCDSIPNLTSA